MADHGESGWSIRYIDKGGLDNDKGGGTVLDDGKSGQFLYKEDMPSSSVLVLHSE